jgi:ParB family chromosome partitioning protein
MKMAKFNLNQLLSGTSLNAEAAAAAGAEREAPARPMLKVIPLNINDLQPSKDNFYSVEHIAELKTSIEMFGVLQNLTVKPLDGGKYEIISGHRRHRACVELVAEGKTEYEYVPCGLQTERDEIKERILLIMTNSTARELSDWEKMKQAEELQEHFTALKKRDNLPGRVRDLVAEALNTSTTQIARLKAISNNLAPELKEEFQAGRLGVSAAYELSGMPEDRQKEALADYQDKGGLSINDVRERKQDAPPERDQDREPDEPERETPPAAATVEPPAERPAPREYPETPPDFEEGQEDEPAAPEVKDFADLHSADKAEAAIAFLSGKRYAIFAPGEDTRIFDYIIEILEYYAEGLS